MYAEKYLGILSRQMKNILYFLGILEIFRLDMGQISPIKKAFAACFFFQPLYKLYNA